MAQYHTPENHCPTQGEIFKAVQDLVNAAGFMDLEMERGEWPSLGCIAQARQAMIVINRFYNYEVEVMGKEAG